MSDSLSQDPAVVDLTRRVGHAEDRLLEIKSELRELNASVKELNATIASMGKPHFQTWAAIGALVLSVCAGAWWLAIEPLKEHLATIDIIDATILPREVSIERWAQVKEEMQQLRTEIDKRATKDDLNRMIIDVDQRLPKWRGK